MPSSLRVPVGDEEIPLRARRLLRADTPSASCLGVQARGLAKTYVRHCERLFLSREAIPTLAWRLLRADSALAMTAAVCIINEGGVRRSNPNAGMEIASAPNTPSASCLGMQTRRLPRRQQNVLTMRTESDEAIPTLAWRLLRPQTPLRHPASACRRGASQRPMFVIASGCS
jgi:hypothetical protein